MSRMLSLYIHFLMKYKMSNKKTKMYLIYTFWPLEHLEYIILFIFILLLRACRADRQSKLLITEAICISISTETLNDHTQ